MDRQNRVKWKTVRVSHHKHHFYATNTQHTQKSVDMEYLIEHMKKFETTFDVFYVPMNIYEKYKTFNTVPNVKGLIFLCRYTIAY